MVVLVEFAGNNWHEKWFACSTECLQKFEKKLESTIAPGEINLDAWSRLNEKGRVEYPTPTARLFDNAILALTTPDFTKKLREKNASIANNSMLYIEFEKCCNLIQARNLESAGYLAEAAAIYEHNGELAKAQALCDQAGQKDRQITVKKVDIAVDLNKLLQQVREDGIVAVYRCPQCGGALRVGKDTSIESLKFCEYCGSEIKAIDLSDFLKTALS